MTQNLHHILLGCGFEYTTASRMPKSSILYSRNIKKGYYCKRYGTTAGEFPVILILRDDPFIELPIAYVQEIPCSLKGKLIPHISHDSTLCYVAQMEADWDSNDLESTYKVIDDQIQITLNNAVISVENGDPTDTEMEGEFAAYWKPEDDLYLLSPLRHRKSMSTYLFESEGKYRDSRKEYITTESTQDKDNVLLSSWLNQRNINFESLQNTPITTHHITVKPTRLAGVNWPPNCLQDVLAWLKEVDHNARNHVIRSLITNNIKRHVLLLDVENQDIVAIYVELNSNALALKRHKKLNLSKTSIHHLATILGGKRSNIDFKRISVIKADQDTLLSRNLNRTEIGNLADKRVALIGCGTIGSYLAGLLLRSGAGCGNKYFHLYDRDDYRPHNFGRHALSTKHFGENKATSLAESISDSIHTARKIEGYPINFPIKSTKLSEYDIVIDATGRPPVSKRLAFIVRTLPTNSRPTLIHAFNDGNGRSSKVFVDNGHCCYGCMISDVSTHRDGIDLRFEGIDQTAEKHISCGSTYTPYDAAVSHITAALTQEAILNTLEPNMLWNYSEHMLDGSRTRKPRKIKQQKGCPICYGR
ncbi:E2/UBC family protein [Vibrio fluvialis]|uniref:E2/UBC family protein n=1 Tax=Vibrio fluvialis TaxID=676 RepID=UPI00301C217D